MNRHEAHDDYDLYSVRKRGRASFRQSARIAAVAMADFWGSIADSAADAFSATADSVAAGCDAGLDRIPVNQPRAQAASFAAAARYFEEMARLAREAEDTSPQSDPCVERIDYQRLAKAVVDEMNRTKPDPPPRVTPA